MTDFYILSGPNDEFQGVFTSPKEAMRYVYLSYVYQITRGYRRDIGKLVWENVSGLHWYARKPEDDARTWDKRGHAVYHIQRASIDWMPPIYGGFDMSNIDPGFDEWLKVYDRP